MIPEKKSFQMLLKSGNRFRVSYMIRYRLFQIIGA